jgi:hypothetical protein
MPEGSISRSTGFIGSFECADEAQNAEYAGSLGNLGKLTMTFRAQTRRAGSVSDRRTLTLAIDNENSY